MMMTTLLEPGNGNEGLPLQHIVGAKPHCIACQGSRTWTKVSCRGETDLPALMKGVHESILWVS